MHSGRTTAPGPNGSIPDRYSEKTLFGAWESMLISRSPFQAATRSYPYLLERLSDAERTTRVPGRRISPHLPVFLTWTRTSSPSMRTVATNLFSLETNSASLVLS